MLRVAREFRERLGFSERDKEQVKEREKRTKRAG